MRGWERYYATLPSVSSLFDATSENREDREFRKSDKLGRIDRRYERRVEEKFKKYGMYDTLAKMTGHENNTSGNRYYYDFDVVKVTKEIIKLNKDYKDPTQKEDIGMIKELFGVLMPLQIELSSKLDSTIANYNKRLKEANLKKNKTNIDKYNVYLNDAKTLKQKLKILMNDVNFPRSVFQSFKVSLFGKHSHPISTVNVAEPNTSAMRIEGTTGMNQNVQLVNTGINNKRQLVNTGMNQNVQLVNTGINNKRQLVNTGMNQNVQLVNTGMNQNVQSVNTGMNQNVQLVNTGINNKRQTENILQSSHTNQTQNQ